MSIFPNVFSKFVQGCKNLPCRTESIEMRTPDFLYWSWYSIKSFTDWLQIQSQMNRQNTIHLIFRKSLFKTLLSWKQKLLKRMSCRTEHTIHWWESYNFTSKLVFKRHSDSIRVLWSIEMKRYTDEKAISLPNLSLKDTVIALGSCDRLSMPVSSRTCQSK